MKDYIVECNYKDHSKRYLIETESAEILANAINSNHRMINIEGDYYDTKYTGFIIKPHPFLIEGKKAIEEEYKKYEEKAKKINCKYETFEEFKKSMTEAYL